MDDVSVLHRPDFAETAMELESKADVWRFHDEHEARLIEGARRIRRRRK